MYHNAIKKSCLLLSMTYYICREDCCLKTLPKFCFRVRIEIENSVSKVSCDGQKDSPPSKKCTNIDNLMKSSMFSNSRRCCRFVLRYFIIYGARRGFRPKRIDLHVVTAVRTNHTGKL